MLLSWHLYDDIAKVVRRNQVVICPNGIPEQSCDEDENENENCLAGNINLTQNTQNSQNTHCFARVGHPEENTTHYTLHTTQESSHTDFNENDNENENADANGASVATAARSISAACDEGRFIFPEERALAPLGLSAPRSLACEPLGWVSFRQRTMQVLSSRQVRLILQ